MSSDNQIKITCFRQLAYNKDQQNRVGRGDYLMNIIIYSPNKKLRFLDSHVKKLNESNQLFIVKCNNLQNFAYSINTCKNGINTICFMDQQLSQEAIKKIIDNQTNMKNLQNFKCCLFVSQVENVNCFMFHIPGVSMISCTQQKLIEFLDQQYQSNRKKLNSYSSQVSIVSEDEIKMKLKLGVHEDKNRKIIDSQCYSSKNQEQIHAFDNGVPGVGTYETSGNQKKAKGYTFDRTK